MDNLTHTLFALTVANAGFRRAGPGTTATLVIASSVPDIEFLAGVVAGRVAYLSAHRGPTHGPLGIGLGILVAGAVFLAYRRRSRGAGGQASFAALALAGVVGVVGHVALDFATSYGTRVLSPFSQTWYGVDWLPIVDVFLLLILAAGLLVTWARPGRRAAIAITVLLAMAGYYGLRASAHHVALQYAVERERANGVDDRSPLRTPFAYLNSHRPAALPAAIPTPTSPFRWRLITRTASGFEVRMVNVLAPGDGEGDVLRFPNDRHELIGQAAAAPTARVFLDFTRFPAVQVLRHANGDISVHWYDMRYGRGPIPGDPREAISPFGAWVRLSPAGAILAYGLGPG